MAATYVPGKTYTFNTQCVPMSLAVRNSKLRLCKFHLFFLLDGAPHKGPNEATGSELPLVKSCILEFVLSLRYHTKLSMRDFIEILE